MMPSDRPLHPPPAEDLDRVVDGLGTRWSHLRAASLLITGGTGVIGRWLIASLLRADDKFRLGVRATILSRDPDTFRRRFTAWGREPRLTWIRGDVRFAELPPGAGFTHAIHGATDVLAPRSPEDVRDTCVGGTRRVLELARLSGVQRLLMISSGAVYGQTPPDLGPIPESFVGPLDAQAAGAAYAQGKRAAELLCAIENARGGITIPVARCFAVVGPCLPLDSHFAIGNFIGAVLEDRPIVIHGDGTPVRSYMYLADVAVRLWLLLLEGRGGCAYNVGGDDPLSIEALARIVVRTLGRDPGITIGDRDLHGAHSRRYHPDTTRIRSEFRLPAVIGLEDAISRTAAWHASHGTL